MSYDILELDYSTGYGIFHPQPFCGFKTNQTHVTFRSFVGIFVNIAFDPIPN
jgi:hypothetical protein